MPLPISPEQEAYFTNNNVKNASLSTWLVFTITHPDWSEDVNLCGLVDGQPLEADDDFYTFEGVTYRPIAMKVEKANESKSDKKRLACIC